MLAFDARRLILTDNLIEYAVKDPARGNRSREFRIVTMRVSYSNDYRWRLKIYQWYRIPIHSNRLLATFYVSETKNRHKKTEIRER